MTRDQRAVNLRRKILEAGIKRLAPKSFFFDLLFSYKSSPSPLQQQLQQQCDQINKCRIDMSVFMIRMCVETECA